MGGAWFLAPRADYKKDQRLFKARAGQVKKVRSLIIFLLLAIVCIGVAACPKGHKSFGGSSVGSGLFGGGGPPSTPGYYYDAGNGWKTFTGGEQDIGIHGDTVSYGWRFTETEKQQIGFIAAAVYIVFGQESPERLITPNDRSNYDAGYMWLEFRVDGPGEYILSDHVHIGRFVK
ncbi:hypothetical protein JXA59_00490 [Patescibacteria group bacterium]|nr:hypothetical protein [Patescibacteria group bacterium]